MKKTTILAIVALGLIISGCNTTTDSKSADSKSSSTKSAAMAGQSVDCKTAEGDLRSLEAEKGHVKKQHSLGIFSITPIGLLATAAMKAADSGDAKNVKVDSKEYDKQIDAKKAEIKKACG
jgi:hypothetical protein